MDNDSSESHNQEIISHHQSSDPRNLPIQLLEEITDGFSEDRILGHGGFGVVYKGFQKNGEVIAVKKLKSFSDISQKQFENEVYHLMKLKHRNIVQLVGYCYEIKHVCLPYNGSLVFAEKMERLLCLEYMLNGSLAAYISDASDSSVVDWHTRYQIIEGICKGLNYLHEEVDKPIIHLDLKPANILLDQYLVPRISDFGLSRLFDQQQTICTATFLGTLGYMAPEVLKGRISPKADIFSLGVIIIEVITGEKDYPDGHTTSFDEYIERELTKWRKKLEKAQEYKNLEIYCQQIKRCIQIGLICVKDDPKKRPTTTEIINMLHGSESTDFFLHNGVTSPADNASLLVEEVLHHIEADASITPAKFEDIVDSVSELVQDDHNTVAETPEQRVASAEAAAVDCVPRWGLGSLCGCRWSMDDTAVVKPRFLDIPLWMVTGYVSVDGLDGAFFRLPAHFFGVYDGHGGVLVADYCRKRIHSVLKEELGAAEEAARGTDLSELEPKKLWEKAFMNCFLRVDAEVGGNAVTAAQTVAGESVGSTAVAAVVCASHIIVANCGDSRAVLCRDKQPLALSSDHRPNREDEYARISALGGKVIQWGGYRVLGVLAVSRSIGDRYLKPYIIPDPEVTVIPCSKDDEFLILASDGLWDVMSNEEVCDVVRERLLGWGRNQNAYNSSPAPTSSDSQNQAAQNAAEYLSALAFKKGSRDNITVIVVDLRSHRKLESTPSGGNAQ